MHKKIVLFSIGIVFIPLFFVKVAIADNANTKLQKPVEFLYVDVDTKSGKKREDRDLLVVMDAEDYKKLFNYVPLERMLRSQIKHQEFVALDQNDLDHLDNHEQHMIIKNKTYLYKIYFAKVGGTIDDTDIESYANLVSFGTLKDIIININHTNAKNKKDEIDEVELSNNTEIKIESGKKRTVNDMPWMGL